MRSRFAGWALLVALVGMGCAEEESAPTLSRDRSLPFRVTKDFHATETAGGKIVWSLQAVEARTYEQPSRTLMDTVRVTFYHEDGSVRSTLTSDYGRVQEDKGLLIAQGNVWLVGVEGDTLTTDFLRYNQEEDEISGPGAVRLAQAGRVMTGKGFRSLPDLSDYEIFEDVKIVSRELPADFKDDE